MQHHKDIRKLGRPTKQRTALMRSLARSLVLHERIETTEARAKELRPYIEKLVTKSMKGDIAGRRLVSSRIGDDAMAKKLIETIAPRYTERPGGYTRITKLGAGGGDARERAIIEFVE